MRRRDDLFAKPSRGRWTLKEYLRGKEIEFDFAADSDENGSADLGGTV
jgi:hypothetical protein